MLQGRAPSISFTIAGHQHCTPYFLADGIYPDWPVFVKPIEKPHGKKQKHFASQQEACRKDVERCFGVLQARWRIIDSPCRLWKANAMGTVMHACIILHNLIVEDELNDNECNGHEHLFQREAQPGGLPIIRITRPIYPPQHATVANIIANSHKVHSSREYYRLREDLINHLWDLHGDHE
eukprot:jgi/Phyca11/98587/e_gw1.3.168.1